RQPDARGRAPRHAAPDTLLQARAVSPQHPRRTLRGRRMTDRSLHGLCAAVTALTITIAPRQAHADCSSGSASDAFEAARRAFDEKRFDESIELLQRAYACDPNPVYLGNIARSYEESNRWIQARGAWLVYLDAIKDERERERITERIAV